MKAFFLSICCSALVFAQHPLNEIADYLVDKNPARTSSMIKSGTFKASVPEYLENTEAGPAYQVVLDYQFNLGLLGNYTGQEKSTIEDDFFSEEFMESLRKNGSYQGEYFHAEHKGYADAKNLDGKIYTHCDKVFLTDLKQPSVFFFWNDVFAYAKRVPREAIQDLKVLAHIYQGIPVLGAVKLDVSGIYKGMAVKAGADFYAKKSEVGSLTD